MRKTIFLLLQLWSFYGLFGQINEYQIPVKASFGLQSQATQAIDTISLPFWDDFSTSALTPDSTLWLYGEHVNVNPGRGLRPPSLNVATFDGTNKFGVPYSPLDQRGLADSLVSQPIDLSTIDAGLQNTLYLSFFWQKRGNGEIPEREDSIRLQFRDVNGAWITQWSAVGGDTSQTQNFKQEIIQVPAGNFQHGGFQFRFQSFGKLTGGYDNWHIDYVLLRTRRSADDTFYRDRTLSTVPSSVFKDFRAIPFEHYCSSAANFIDSAEVWGFSLEPPVGFPASIRFGAQIINSQTGAIIDEMNNTAEDGLVFNGQQFIEIQANGIDTTALLAAKSNEDLDITTKFFIRTKDSLLFDFINPSGDSVFFNNIDLTVNDTATAELSLGIHYAYDDGQAETGAGVNRLNGQLAYLFVLPQEDTLTAIDIYFPNTESDQGNESVRLAVWRKLMPEEQRIHTQTIFLTPSDTLDDFVRFPLSRALLVSDSLFIGIQQIGETPIIVGLDKNGNSGDKMYFNTAGIWQANSSVSGHLMMRPIFGSTDDVITSAPDPPSVEALQLYPIPLRGTQLNIKGQVQFIQNVEAWDLQGRNIPTVFDKTRKLIEFPPVEPGVYLIRIHTHNQVHNQKVIITR